MKPDRPTLFAELVDRTDPARPVVLARSTVLITLDPDAQTDVGCWRVRADQVADGHHLGEGDVVYTRTANDRRWWLTEVTATHVGPTGPVYDVTQLRVSDYRPDQTLNDDPRWRHTASAGMSCEELPLGLPR